MKKIVFSICLAALAISCTKTEVNYGASEQISFAPVAHTQTKAAMKSGDVPTTDLIVSATAGPAGATLASNCSEPYFHKVTFIQEGTTGIFKAEGYFWPNVKYLSFAGVTNAAGLADATNYTIDVAANTIVINNYPQQEVGTVNNDLLWFESTIPAGKPSPTNTSYRAETVTMMHACSWIVLNFNGDDTASNVNRPWNITKVTINNLAATGDVVLTSTATWPTLKLGKKNKTLAVYNDSEGTNLKLNDFFTPSKDGIIVIPQEPTTVSVTYNYLSQGANTLDTTDDIKIEETATISLAYDGNASWLPGTKYTYDIKLTATGIKIAPTASSWVDYDADGDNTNGNQSIPGTI